MKTHARLALPALASALIVTTPAWAQSAFEAAQGRGREAAATTAPGAPSPLETIASDALENDTIAYDFVEGVTTEVGPRQAGTQAEARARAPADKPMPINASHSVWNCTVYRHLHCHLRLTHTGHANQLCDRGHGKAATKQAV